MGKDFIMMKMRTKAISYDFQIVCDFLLVKLSCVRLVCHISMEFGKSSVVEIADLFETGFWDVSFNIFIDFNEVGKFVENGITNLPDF